MECGCAGPRPPPLANRKRQAFPFTLRQMTPALIESTGAASGGQAVGQAVDGAVSLSPEEHNELLQRAFKEGARLGGNQGRFGLGASVAQVADWLRLAGAQGGREHDLAPKEKASGAPAGRV